MDTYNGIFSWFENIQNFLNCAPRKIVELFWEEFEKANFESVTKRELQKLSVFFSDWDKVMLFFYGGKKPMKNDIVYEEMSTQYELFNIPKSQRPYYNGNPDDFVKDFRKISLLRVEPSYYAAGTKSMNCEE